LAAGDFFLRLNLFCSPLVGLVTGEKTQNGGKKATFVCDDF
jgi:hypothetical protein